MKRIKSFVFLIVMLAVPAFASRRIVPLAGHLPGANNTFWTTDLQLTNTSAQSEVVHLTFYPNGRSPVSRDFTLASGESRLIEDVTAPSAFGVSSDTSWLGQLELSSNDDFAATARTFTRNDSSSGTYGSVSDSIDPSLLARGGTITGLVSDDRFRTNLALANASDDSVSVHFELRRRDGSIVASDDVPLQPHQTQQISTGRYLSRSDDSPFAVRWSSASSAYLIASTVDNRSGDPTESRSVGAPSRSLFFPLVGKTAGANNTFWTTSLSITNTEDRVADVTIDYQGNDGTHISKNVSIASFGTFQSDDIFAFFNLASGSGYLTITSATEVTASARVFNSGVNGATFGSALLPQERESRSGLTQINGVRRDDDFRLNVAIGNDNSVDVDGEIRLFDDRHNEVEHQQFHVPSRTTLQFGVSQTSVKVGTGEIEVETEHGTPVSVIASNIDNRSGDTVAREPEQENERQQELEIQMSAKTAAAGTPVTFTAVASSSLQISSYHWDFGDGTSADGKTVTHAFAGGGEFNVTLTLTLAGGATLRKVEDITITGGTTPGASGFDFTWSPQSPAPGSAVTFTAVISGSAKPGAFIKWHIETDRPTGASVTHTFATAGSFEVEAELEQEGLLTLKATHEVQIGGGGNPGGGGAGTTAVDFTWSPSSPKAGQAVTFTATLTGDPLAGSEIKWKFPDNSRPSGTTATYTFPSAGTFKVSFEVAQPGRVSVQREKNVTVSP